MGRDRSEIFTCHGVCAGDPIGVCYRSLCIIVMDKWLENGFFLCFRSLKKVASGDGKGFGRAFNMS